MASNTNWPDIDGRAEPPIGEALERLNGVTDELVVDFSAVRRIRPAGLEELEQLAAKAQANSVKVTLRGVNTEVYKVLKLVALAPRFSFLS